MTPFPHSIAPTASLERAAEMMNEHNVRHLPVRDEDHQVVGVLSQREMKVGLAASDGKPRTVLEICTKEPLLVDLERQLDNVTAEMAELRIGSAIVMRGDKLAGILTTTDVCRLLTELLREQGSTEDDDVA